MKMFIKIFLTIFFLGCIVFMWWPELQKFYQKRKWTNRYEVMQKLGEEEGAARPLYVTDVHLLVSHLKEDSVVGITVEMKSGLKPSFCVPKNIDFSEPIYLSIGGFSEYVLKNGE